MRRTFAPFVGAVLVSALVLFTPGGQVPTGPWWSDDVVHAGVFLLLTVTGLLLPVTWPVLTGWLVGYAALSEVVHAVAPLHRTGSVLDVLADIVGIALGLGVGAACAVLARAPGGHDRRTPRA